MREKSMSFTVENIREKQTDTLNVKADSAQTWHIQKISSSVAHETQDQTQSF